MPSSWNLKRQTLLLSSVHTWLQHFPKRFLFIHFKKQLKRGQTTNYKVSAVNKLVSKIWVQKKDICFTASKRLTFGSVSALMFMWGPWTSLISSWTPLWNQKDWKGVVRSTKPCLLTMSQILGQTWSHGTIITYTLQSRKLRHKAVFLSTTPLKIG